MTQSSTPNMSQKPTRLGEDRRVAQWDIIPNQVKQRHIDGMIIFRGVAADRPTNSPVTEVLAYFATDTGVLSIWDGSQWVSTTLS